jgi:hypothetical protein
MVTPMVTRLARLRGKPALPERGFYRHFKSTMCSVASLHQPERACFSDAPGRLACGYFLLLRDGGVTVTTVPQAFCVSVEQDGHVDGATNRAQNPLPAPAFLANDIHGGECQGTSESAFYVGTGGQLFRSRFHNSAAFPGEKRLSRIAECVLAPGSGVCVRRTAYQVRIISQPAGERKCFFAL